MKSPSNSLMVREKDTVISLARMFID